MSDVPRIVCVKFDVSGALMVIVRWNEDEYLLEERGRWKVNEESKVVIIND